VSYKDREDEEMGRDALLRVLLLGASSLLVSGAAAQLTLPAQQGSSDVTWSLAATGDTVTTRRISVYETYPAFKSLVAVIRAADAGFTNLEISLFRMADFNGYPQAESGGIWFVGPPEAAQDLKWMGFNLFNRANNHATEYGVEGMIETDRLLDSLSLVHAGSGMTLGEATQARYLDTNRISHYFHTDVTGRRRTTWCERAARDQPIARRARIRTQSARDERTSTNHERSRRTVTNS
jgi:hypothetical protein